MKKNLAGIEEAVQITLEEEKGETTDSDEGKEQDTGDKHAQHPTSKAGGKELQKKRQKEVT